MTDNNILTQEKAAELIGVKPTTLSAWRHFGRGPTYLKIGRYCFYRREDIETWLDAQAVVPVPKMERTAAA
jgi:transcriptional regulator with XRE-family HTH domain